MTRKDSVRAAADQAKESVRHAADVVAPYAGTARDAAVHYAHEARVQLAPKVSTAARQVRTTAGEQYHARVAPHLEHVRGSLPPKVDQAAARARAVAEPVRDEAVARSAAALAALRGHVSAEEIDKLVKRRDRRCRSGRVAKRVALLGLLAGGAYAAWKWWDKQANPDWLVEPPAPTEIADRAPLSSVDGSAEASLDPEVQAKQDREDRVEDEIEERGEQR
ncbi:DUF5324 family protein [Streptomyces albireticuli]|uniref:Transcriptional regulator n=1 Tax=Streptomyces albireticuli TaxID=1940 RepID=A0A2A2D8K0_9ACTN|nr:DUF5324 family protein [Streptomyces albireticuli]MCD9143794.1 DUF5324 family protein [Streptomyces albireticuli]MCD9161775.1 DUF5324 family protein [Streptomyces albireticuli]MCD9191911.1 DUF5324 family protein [Streptomyces albireticuli]PAU48788.1 transcriptional regulator [Streptomyces albireticuli]